MMNDARIFSEETPAPWADDPLRTAEEDFVQAVRLALANDQAGRARSAAA